MSLNTYNISYLHKTRPYGKTLPGSHRNEEIRKKIRHEGYPFRQQLSKSKITFVKRWEDQMRPYPG